MTDMFKSLLPSLTRIAARFLGYGLLGAAVVCAIVVAKVLESRPDLSVWHEVELDEEFTLESMSETSRAIWRSSSVCSTSSTGKSTRG